MRRILVVRNDKIGDFMLAWPSFAALKQSQADSLVVALVPKYTRDLALLCPWIDEVITDCTKSGSKAQQQELVSTIRNYNFDDYICLFSNTRNALLGFKCRIPYRLAPATKLAQFLFTDTLKQKRSQSAKPEHVYNVDLIKYYLSKHQLSSIEGAPAYLEFEQESLKHVKQALLPEFALNKRLIMIHCGSGGSANNLSLEQYAKLMFAMYQLDSNFVFCLTAGPGELEQTQKLADQATKLALPLFVFESTSGLEHFCQVIACADLFIAGSTGPLHIAGALNVPTVGFYPAKRSSTPLRWQTLNSDNNRLAFSPDTKENVPDDLSSIDPVLCAKQINQWLNCTASKSFHQL
ncbi:lipopolysaccharide heptosyltransferase family protein [Alginatibacterium sediminis]|uniref:Lipopolysaccharide heptosyltransferase family protein n=1 Tax=Alginatibacterium sediminis TaxID=2164068 RepID=A0A420ENB1_9ALTE|nr:glycosyltransferase family 9 protein [Alginatibacterium sediminis]RKF22143.1 lipopolysaccharide heptosyltransferase family protein [Alginatibacterium sediminis]